MHEHGVRTKVKSDSSQSHRSSLVDDHGAR
jgi:hypothetical protein